MYEVKTTVSGIDELKRAFRQLSESEAKTALRNTLNDSARDVLKREEREILAVFDRPTRIIQRAFFVQRASTSDLSAKVKLKDVFGQDGGAIANTLHPHIPGHPDTRNAKGMEVGMRAKGLLTKDQYLVPSRTMRLDRYGNITGATASKMLNDLWVFDNVAGFDSNTGDAKSKYIFGEIRPRGKQPFKGIFDTSRFLSGRPNALMMLVINRSPKYKKRFDFYGVGQAEASRVMPGHAIEAIRFALARSFRQS